MPGSLKCKATPFPASTLLAPERRAARAEVDEPPVGRPSDRVGERLRIGIERAQGLLVAPDEDGTRALRREDAAVRVRDARRGLLPVVASGEAPQDARVLLLPVGAAAQLDRSERGE